MNKLYISACIAITSFTTIANEDEIYETIKVEYNKSISEFNDKSLQCESGHPGLQVKDLTTVNLKDKKTLLTMVNYYYFQTLHTCLATELNIYSTAATKLWTQDKSNKEALYKMNYLMMNIPISLEQAKVDYLKIPANIRKSYSKINEIQQPFDMLETIDNLAL